MSTFKEKVAFNYIKLYGMSSRKVCFSFLILNNFDCFAFENTFDNIKPQILITCSTRAKKKCERPIWTWKKPKEKWFE